MELFFWGKEEMKTRGDKRMIKIDIYKKKLSFLDIYWKLIGTFTFNAWLLPLIHILFTPT